MSGLPVIVLRPEPGLSETLAAAEALGLTAMGAPLSAMEPVAFRSSLGPRNGSMMKPLGFQPQVKKVWPKSASDFGMFHLLATSKNPPTPAVVFARKRTDSSPAPCQRPCRTLLMRRPG